MAKPRLFISYDYDNDKHYKNLLVAWDKNSEFDFSFYDESVDVSVDSTNAAVIKRVIAAKIGGATHFLCLVGKATHTSRWVKWEIEKAKELERMLVAAKIDRENTSPSGLIDAGVSWAMSFSFDSIKKAVERT